MASLIGKGLNFHPYMMAVLKLGPILDFSGSDFVHSDFQNAMMGVA